MSNERNNQILTELSKRIPLPNGKFTVVDDGDFAWLSQWAWHCSSKGYVRRYAFENGKRVLVTMHRLIMSAPKGLQVDHRDGDKLNNQRNNLRLADNQQNCCNKDAEPGKSGYRGVTRVSRSKRESWSARIKVNGKYIHLGCFPTKIEAANERDRAAIQYYGEFARLNFPDDHGNV